MSIIKKMRKQDAVYWPLEGRDDFNSPEYGNPVDVVCRWEDVNEAFTDDKGEERQSKAKVYTDIIVEPGGLMMLGTIEELEYFNEPFKNEGVYEIQRFDRLPNLKAKEFLQIAYLGVRRGR